jgi:hypothetical protein
MSMIVCVLVATAFILLYYLAVAFAFDVHSVYGQNVTQFLPSSGSITYHLIPSSEIASVAETSASSKSTPISIIMPPTSSEALTSNHKAASSFLSSVTYTSIDTSINRNAAVVSGSTTTPFTATFVNESSSTVTGS